MGQDPHCADLLCLFEAVLMEGAPSNVPSERRFQVKTGKIVGALFGTSNTGEGQTLRSPNPSFLRHPGGAKRLSKFLYIMGIPYLSINVFPLFLESLPFLSFPYLCFSGSLAFPIFPLFRITTYPYLSESPSFPILPMESLSFSLFALSGSLSFPIVPFLEFL